MIAFDLQCENGHTFEGWFQDNAAYTKQKQGGLIACPVCNDTSVSKIPSTFAIKSAHPSRILPKDPSELANLGRRIVNYVERNFDDVGCDFAKEALKIHYGAAEPRNIRGFSTSNEEKTLKEEGVQFFKIPIPPSSSENDS